MLWEGWDFMLTILIVSVVICVVVFVLFAIAITKGYSYKHKIDPIDENPHLDFQKDENNKQ